MSKPFLQEIENSFPDANRKKTGTKPFSSHSPKHFGKPRTKVGKNDRPGNPRGNFINGNSHQKNRGPGLPSYILETRAAMSEGGIIVVLYIVDMESRFILFAPRIESRGFFLPNEVREGHKFLLSLARTRYEETLRDIPDIETKDLEKIIRADMEKSILEKFSRSTVVIPLISFV